MQNIKNYNNIFNLKNVFTLLNYKKKNYSINLLLNKEFLYKLLYFLFKKKFSILQKYLLKNLMLNRIYKFISFVNILILFVLKSNNILRFYINYCSLNIIIIKNKYFLILIKKILNYLINIVYFIKLYLKNTCYRICIC